MKVSECTLLPKGFRLFLKNKLQELGVDEPALIFTGRKGSYYWKDTIYIGNYDKAHALKSAVLHELAHHINHKINEKKYWDDEFKAFLVKVPKPHGAEFFDILLDLIKESHIRHNWRGEYRSLKKEYKNRRQG
jgi:hypothetical protein